jgi:RNA-binding protein
VTAPEKKKPPTGARGAAPRLTSKQRMYLRGLGHHLDPVVLVGKEAVTDGLLAATGEQLAIHELIKVRFGDSAGDRHELAEALSSRAAAALVQVVGRVALLYRPRDEEPGIKLP